MLQAKKLLRYLRTNLVDHDAVHPARDGHSNSLAPQPPYRTIGRRSVRADMLGHPRMASLSRLGDCWRCYSAIRACVVLRHLAHGWSCCGGPVCPTVLTLNKTFGVCVSSFSFERLPAGRLNRHTGQKLACQPLRRRRLGDLEHSCITLVATLIFPLIDLRPHKNMVDD